MGDWKLISVLIGVLGALFGVYFREALRLSFQQKSIASRLNSYLFHWQTVILEEDKIFNITYFGIEWHKEYISAIRNGSSAEELVRLNQKWENKLKEIKEAIEKNDPDFNVNEAEINQQFSKIKHRIGEIIETLKLARQNIIDAKSYISDQEAGLLGYHTSASIIELKMRIISLIDYGHLMLYEFQVKDTIRLQDYADEIYRLIRSTVMTAKCMEVVRDKINFILKQTILNLVFKNMSGKL